MAAWIDALPAESRRERREDLAPFSGVSWSETRKAGGWPPTRFIGRARERLADTLLVTTLRWTIEKLVEARRDAVSAWPDADGRVRKQLEIAEVLLEQDPLRSASPIRPRRPDIVALRHEGRPWHLVAPVADELRAVEESPVEFATRLIAPDEELRWRLFHLAVLGSVLVSLKACGSEVTWLRPLSGGSSGPAYSVLAKDGRVWDLWFEAGGMWSSYGAPSPYAAAAAGVPGAGGPLGADVALVRPGEDAVLFECKYSWSPQVVARAGYEQALAYLAEAKTGLVKRARAVVVGPEGVVEHPSTTNTFAGTITIARPNDLLDIVCEGLGVA
ncbi:hypothetical protein [Anaeromyxobacter sp. SG66]|uniref:hypothetical protein n=1 Tax=Anaeromyxobacter sp. SG66 TaxID=2925410 RepID=UPI001F5799AB|nr:hypothetical protein [Anaeromyxobacter sp. SG66]